MKPSQRPWATNEALGVASILQTVMDGGFNLEQDLKGRWHIWQAPATEQDHSDSIARQLEPDFQG
jgi:hypothetical protein